MGALYNSGLAIARCFSINVTEQTMPSRRPSVKCVCLGDFKLRHLTKLISHPATTPICCQYYGTFRATRVKLGTVRGYTALQRKYFEQNDTTMLSGQNRPHGASSSQDAKKWSHQACLQAVRNADVPNRSASAMIDSIWRSRKSPVGPFPEI